MKKCLASRTERPRRQDAQGEDQPKLIHSVDLGPKPVREELTKNRRLRRPPPDGRRRSVRKQAVELLGFSQPQGREEALKLVEKKSATRSSKRAAKKRPSENMQQKKYLRRRCARSAGVAGHRSALVAVRSVPAGGSSDLLAGPSEDQGQAPTEPRNGTNDAEPLAAPDEGIARKLRRDHSDTNHRQRLGRCFPKYSSPGYLLRFVRVCWMRSSMDR